MNPIDGDLYGYCSGSSTWIFQTPSSKGAAEREELGCQLGKGGKDGTKGDPLSAGP